jgi:dihydrodiol dehydrogenase / D-xylose 1-dehydrogenase (NADP)
MALRWGIVSSGKICHDMVVCLQSLDQEEHRVVANAARSRSSAEKFAAAHNIQKFYGSYQELANDPDVDIAYIGTINPHHITVTKAMLQAGKHVLCEKPLGMNVREVKEMISLAREKKLFLMEAIWSRCFPAYDKIRELISAGTIGDVLHVLVQFGEEIDKVDRVSQKELGGGALLDIGIYTLQFISLSFNGQTPTKIVATGQLNDSGVDESVSSTFLYKRGGIAHSFITTRAKLGNEAKIIGTKGSLTLAEPFWCSTRLDTPTGTIEFPLPKVTGQVNFENSEGLCYEATEVRRCIQQGLLECPLLPHSESLLIATMMDEIRKLVGVEYPQDKP